LAALSQMSRSSGSTERNGCWMSVETFQIPAAALSDLHVQSSMSMIMAAANLAERGSVALLGPGKGTEIPLRHLASKFDRIDCVDLDSNALSLLEARCRDWEEARNRCYFHNSDLTGLLPQILSQMREKLAESSDPSACLDNLCAQLDSAQPKFWRAVSSEPYSLVICSAVLTQLQASVRKSLEGAFLNKFPAQAPALSNHAQWRTSVWRFARRIEDAFILHLASLTSPHGIVYLSDTVHMCWLRQSGPELFTTEGSWIATRTERLTDYLHSWDEILAQDHWDWLRLDQSEPYFGRVYGVQAIIYRAGRVGGEQRNLRHNEHRMGQPVSRAGRS
jgi:hypothetical protein